jgi:hypothetical protein
MTTPSTWTVNGRALVDVVVHRHALRVPCIIREVRQESYLDRAELIDMPQRFWVGPDEVHEDDGSPPTIHPEA